MARRDDEGEPEGGPPSAADPGYALGQLERALRTCAGHEDPDVRARASRRVEQWRSVLAGMSGGTLRIGSRVPVANVPAWATLEVVHGGFATGRLVAGGPLEEHETALLAELGEGSATDRLPLNLYHVGDAGRARLLDMLRTGRYRVQVPEEGALLVVAWLIERGEPERAAALLDAITPAFDRLRFYPVPDAQPFVATGLVKLQTIGETIAQLERVRPNLAIERMNETLSVWGPLADRMVQLLLGTVEGEVPRLRTAEDGTLVRRPDGQPEVVGGWPLRRLPTGFRDEARALVAEARVLRARHPLSARPARAKSNLSRLRSVLERCADDPRRLTGRDVGLLRRVLASYVTRHGVPGSEAHAARRHEQVRIAALPTHRALRAALVARLRARPADGGVGRLEPIVEPLSDAEAERAGAPAGTALPDHLAAKVARCLEATIDELLEREVIGSGEVLARVLPQMTSQIRATGLADPELRGVYAAVYGAFRRRRSLLLLHLEHQVRLEELPWIAAIDAFRAPELDAANTARQALEQIATLAVTSFPQTILPNKLLGELSALVKAAGLALPITDELAVDIFMGDFTPKFVEAAKVAARLLAGTLYERYYGLPFDRVRDLHDFVTKQGHRAPCSPGFAALCVELARVEHGGRWSPARNGKIIEQQQLLTTHNLAVLFDAFGLAETLAGSLARLAERCFIWICRRQRMKHREWRSELRAVKDCAYAWRQMMFFLSLVAPDELDRFVRWVRDQLDTRVAEDLRARLAPAVGGLVHVAAGGRFDEGGRAPNGGRRFLGWSTDRHWLVREKTPRH